jgi:hypothetical protein
MDNEDIMHTQSRVRYFIGAACCVIVALVVTSCSELKKDLPAPTAPRGVHETGWNDTLSANFHGKVLKGQQYNAQECVSCHAKEYTGGTSGVACVGCHASYPHKAGWADTSAGSHGAYLLAGMGPTTDCARCHGTAFDGGTSNVSCYGCHASYPHVSGWQDPATPTSHGEYLKAKQWGTAECKSCHGTDFAGGSSRVACTGCHATYPHKAEWADTSAGSHGAYLLAGMGQITDCARCHGAAYDGGTSNVSCYGCHALYPHVSGWQDPATLTSHGKYLKAKQWGTAECKSCHGTDFAGGSSRVACTGCHATYPHSAAFAPAGGHTAYMTAHGYPYAQCQTCHGSAYAGGAVVNVSCSSTGCHEEANGTPKSPEACNTCHGTFRAAANDSLSAAPPLDVSGNSSTSSRGVGAHARHLVSGTLGRAVQCQQCHTVPATVFAPGHLGSGPPAEIVFSGTLAALPTANGAFIPLPAYDAGALKCSDTYCHGSWRVSKASAPAGRQFAYLDSLMTGAGFAPVWNQSAGQAACGSCHGLPPAGHLGSTSPVFPINSCSGCHYDVDINGNIIDPAKHINGKINYKDTERSF